VLGKHFAEDSIVLGEHIVIQLVFYLTDWMGL
jgi:hypothetical protein